MGVTQGFVLPSGTGLCLEFDSFVTAVSTGDEIQSVTLSGNPTGGTFTLSFNGQTTSAIPAIPSPPYRYFQWNKTLTAPGTYDLAVNIFQGGTATPAQLYEVFDGTTPLGTKILNHQGDAGQAGGPTNVGQFTDPTGLHTVHGDPVKWYPLGRFTFSGTALAVRTSCDFAANSIDRFDCDNLRIATTDGAVVVRVGPAHPPGTIASPDFQIGTSIDGYQVADDTDPNVSIDGLGSGVRYLVDPAVVQSALAALSSVGVGNVTVTGDGSPINRLKIEFTGALTASSQPLITATDAAVSVAEVVPGGTLPRIVVNGGSPVQVPFSWILCDPGGMATVSIYPPVCSPTPVYRSIGQYDDGTHGRVLNGSWGMPGAGLNQLAQSTTSSSATASWYYGPWKGATYRLSATWPPAAGQSTSVTYTVKDWSGNTFGSHTVDQTVAPSGATDQGVPWEVLGTYTVPGEVASFVVVQSNGTSSTMVADAIRIERTSADDTLRFAPGDTVAVTWGAGWATSQSGGAIAAQASPVTLDNRSGGQLVPPPPPTHQCEIGYNMAGTGGNGGSMIYQDVMAFGSDLVDGFPTTINYFFQDFGVNASPNSYDSDTLAWPNIPPGDYTLTWTGSDDCTIVSSGSAIAEHADQAVYPGTAGSHNKRVYALGGGATRYGAEIKIRIHGATATGTGQDHFTDVTAVHLWPPGTDLDSPPKYRADWLAREAATQCRRHMDPLAVITGNPTSYEDFQPPQSRISKNVPARRITANVASMAPYTGTLWHLDPSLGPAILVTTTLAHGFSNNQMFHFSDDFSAVINLDNGTTFGFGAGDGFINVVDATSFVFIADFAGPNRAMVGTVTGPTGDVHVDCGAGMPLQDMVESFNLVASLRSFYFNSAACTTQDAIEKCFTYLGQNLKAGARVRLECMNETWNQGAVNRICKQNTYTYGYGTSDNAVPYTCQLANQHWAWGKAAWIAAGRSGADFIRVIGTQHADAGVTQRTADYCVANGLSMGDELSTAPYLNCSPSITRNVGAGPDFSPLKSRLTVGQTLDQNEVYFTFGGYEGECQAHIQHLSAFPGMGLNFYEFSPQNQTLSGTNGPQTNHGVVRHPRWKGIFEHIVGTYATTGCEAIHDYLETSVDRPDGFVWATYNYTGQLPYTQSTAQDAIQIDTPDRIDLIQSVQGAAMNRMGALFGATPGPLAAGTVTAGSVTGTTATVSIATDTGGSGSFSNQAQVTPYSLGTWTDNGSPVTGDTATLTVTGLSPGTPYSVRVVVSDGVSSPATSNAVNVTTAAGGSLTAGTVTPGSTTGTTANATATEATGGTGTIAHQWYRSSTSGVLGSAVSGQTTTTLADTGLTTATTYYYTLRYTDSTSAHVDSNQVAETTTSGSPGVFPVVVRSLRPFRHVGI